MSAYGFVTAGQVINNALVEVGLPAVSDPYASEDSNAVQMQTLLATAGKMLLRDNNWQKMIREHSITTNAATDNGVYTLPVDFLRKVPQTGWNTSSRLPLVGPLNAQDWTYLEGRGLQTGTIYVSFRLQDGQFTIYPNDPVPDAETITFEYLSQYWVQDAAVSTDFKAAPQSSGDVVLYDEVMITHLLRARWLGARGFDDRGAVADFNRAYGALTGQDEGGSIINAGGASRGTELINPFRNTPDTGYGNVV